MLRRILIPMVLAVIALSACGSPTQIEPTIIIKPSTPVPSDGTYPYPVVPTVSMSIRNPYPAPGENPYSPAAGDETMTRGDAVVDTAASQLILAESMPVQVTLRLVGTLPTPCYKPRVVIPQADAQNRVYVEVYGVAAPDQVCAAVLSPFDIQFSMGSFSDGKFSVYVNGELLGELDS